MTSSEDNVLAFAWYRREDYRKLRERAEDPDTLFETYDAWHNDAKQAFAKYEQMGFEPQKLIIDVDELVEWCDDRDRPVDEASRQMFKKIKRASFYAARDE